MERVAVLSCGLSDISIPRIMSHTSVSLAQTREVHIFSDSSEKAIAASAYLSE